MLISIFRAPRSYTGEDLAEISCHGGRLIPQKVIELLIDQGARPAEPGEFTQRAFLMGKLDLSQAEAVQTLIAAQSESAIHFAQQQLSGSIKKSISKWQSELVRIAAILEAWVDFPEDDLEFAPFEKTIQELKEIQERISLLSSTYTHSKILRCGCRVCLVGAPNVGKSSLLNALLKKDRAIVSPYAGTTRDIVEDQLLIGGVLFHLADTAGLRDAEDVVEQEGIRRSQEALEQADLILFVLDASRAITFEELSTIANLDAEKTLLIWNKCDLVAIQSEFQKINPALKSILISAKEELGIEELKSAMKKLSLHDTSQKHELVITEQRHATALNHASKHLSQVIEGLKNQISPEFVCLDLRASLLELGTVIGQNVTEEILDSIFSQFCLGK